MLAVPDGRSEQGRDHPVAVVLALVAAATVAGSKGYTAMTGRVADVPAEVMASLYIRVDARPAGRPSRSTIWQVCTDTDADVLDAVIAEWTTAQQVAATAGVAKPSRPETVSAAVAANTAKRLITCSRPNQPSSTVMY